MSDAGGGMAEDPVCPHAPLIDANDLGTKDCSSARRNLLTKHVWSIRVRLEIARSVCDSKAAMRAKIVGDIVWRIIRSKHPATYLYLCARLRRSIFLTGRCTSVSEVVTNRKNVLRRRRLASLPPLCPAGRGSTHGRSGPVLHACPGRLQPSSELLA